MPTAELHARIHARWPLQPLQPSHRGEVAERHAFVDGQGEVGFISSVSQPFCGGCTRARMSSAGVLYTCLFATQGIDLRAPLRAGASDEDLVALITGRWQAREDRYSEQRGQPSTEAATDPRKVEMHHIGG
jgi:cyclic pyranopterin phosphate synthase